MNFMEIYKNELDKVNALMGNSKFSSGIAAYAREITDDYNIVLTGDETPEELEKKCLNGATSWWKYANGACALAYDEDIKDRLCTESEKKSGKRPAAIVRECGRGATWIDAEATALEYAFGRIKKAFKRAKEKTETA